MERQQYAEAKTKFKAPLTQVAEPEPDVPAREGGATLKETQVEAVSMIGFLLFLVLVVLIYMAGLLPGVIKVISIILAIAIVSFSAGVYGWHIVLGGFVAALAIAGIGIWLADYKSTKVPKITSNHNDIDYQLAKFNAEQSQKRKEAEKSKVIQEQVKRTERIGETVVCRSCQSEVPGHLTRCDNCRESL